jgi:hypothetical protein
MAAFNRDDVTGDRQFTNDLRPERGFPTSERSARPAWVALVVVVAAVFVVLFSYESGNRSTHSSAAPTSGVTNPIPTPPPAKP